MTDDIQESSARNRFPNVPRTMENRGGNTNLPQQEKAQVGILPNFSTLPANSGRFAFGQQLTFAGNNTTFTPVFTLTVPNGRVINAEQLRVNVIDTFDGGGISLGVPASLLTVSLFVNNSSEPFNQNIIMQPFDNFYPCTVVAPAGAIITIKVSFDYSTIPTPPTTVLFKSDLTGVMLLASSDIRPEDTGLKLPTLPIRGR